MTRNQMRDAFRRATWITDLLPLGPSLRTTAQPTLYAKSVHESTFPTSAGGFRGRTDIGVLLLVETGSFEARPRTRTLLADIEPGT